MTPSALPTAFGRGVSPAARPPGPIVVRLQGEHDIATATTLWKTLTTATALSDDDLVVDLEGAEFVDASTIGVLVRTGQLLASQGRSLAVRAPSDLVHHLFEICGLTGLLEREPSIMAPATDPDGLAGARMAPGAGAGRGVGPGPPAPWGEISQATPVPAWSGAYAVATSRLDWVRR